MRALEVAAVFAQGTSALPGNGVDTKIRLALGAILVLVGAWIGVVIAAKSKKQQTSESLGIAGRFGIGVLVFAGALVAIPLATRVWEWLGLV